MKDCITDPEEREQARAPEPILYPALCAHCRTRITARHTAAGTGQTAYGLNWGNGFITQRDVISGRRRSDPTAFFQDLLTKPYADKVVFAPHVYPPSITLATFLGTSLWDQCRTAFGYLQAPGFCPPAGGACRRFPVVVGEVGSALHDDTDKQWLQDFADFVNAEVGACGGEALIMG